MEPMFEWNFTESTTNNCFYTMVILSKNYSSNYDDIAVNVTDVTRLWNFSTGFEQNCSDTIIDWLNSDYFNLTDNVNNITKFPKDTQQRQFVKLYYPIIAAEMVLSCICLIFSLVVYAKLPEFHNVHGKNLMSMSACLLITDVMLFFDLIVRKYISLEACFVIAIVIHVTFLGNFFWTNVMAFDIWRSLASIKSRGEVKSSSNKYLKYSVYAWTATILTTLPAIVLEFTDVFPEEYKPKFGVKRCWLSGTKPFLIYFNLPVGIILFANLVMFLLTVRKLWLIKKTTAILKVKQQEERLNLYLKLFLVMGITWITEYLPLMTGKYWMYIIAGMMTALHGFFLFLIFVCKPKIISHYYRIIVLRKKILETGFTRSSTSGSRATKISRI